MNRLIKKVSWLLFALLGVAIGLYPLMYFIVDRHFGLLSSKTPELLNDLIWNIAFYGHIIPGGLALGIGWLQFSEKIRKTKMHLHRRIGKIYMIAVLLSGLCSLYIGFFATGGIMSMSGFITLGIIWLITTYWGYDAIKNGKVAAHQKFMIFSYAACFAAVTLRIWLPLLIMYFQGEFLPAYKIVAWLCWVPNIIVAYLITRSLKLSS